MKRSLTLGLILTAISASAMATTMATPPAPNQPAGDHMEKPMGMMQDKMGGNMHNRMEEHMDRMWKEMDANGDGSISSEESAAFGKKKFDERDANHDGKVTREEWDAFGEARRKEMMEKMGKMHEGMPMGGGMPPMDGKKPDGATPPVEKK